MWLKISASCNTLPGIVIKHISPQLLWRHHICNKPQPGDHIRKYPCIWKQKARKGCAFHWGKCQRHHTKVSIITLFLFC